MKKILKQKKEFKETRKKGREKENERERGEREGERKGYSFRELSSHVKDSYDCAPNCICIQISVFHYFILQWHFPYKEHYSLPRTSFNLFPHKRRS